MKTIFQIILTFLFLSLSAFAGNTDIGSATTVEYFPATQGDASSTITREIPSVCILI